jgi:cyclophilin family peptidyl-prolyl cis-trans isomerase
MRAKKYLTNIYIASLVCLGLISGCFKDDDLKSQAPISDSSQIRAQDLIVDKNGLSTQTITLKTVHGNISFKLYPKKAPNTVTRIIELVNQGFYDGVKFHRVVKNFVVQAGDPTGTGSGGSGKKLKAEFNDIQHIRGTVAMARTTDPDSADSQFYISLTTVPHLDRKYTVFGQVINGLDTLEKIQKDDVIISMVFQK